MLGAYFLTWKEFTEQFKRDSYFLIKVITPKTETESWTVFIACTKKHIVHEAVVAKAPPEGIASWLKHSIRAISKDSKHQLGLIGFKLKE